MHFFPWVTVICSCYNHQDYVITALESVKAQTYARVELIVVDDFSNDDSRKIIKTWIANHPEIVYIENPINLGLNASVNHALKKAKGTYFMDFAADDVLLPNCIESLVEKYQTNPNYGFVFGNADIINAIGEKLNTYFNSQRVEKIENAISDHFYQHLLKKSDVICSISALYNKTIFNQLKGYDEDLYFEDLDYWLRVSKKHPIAFVNKVLVQKRHLENSLENAFFYNNHHTKQLHITLYLIFKKAYKLNTKKSEYIALLPRIYKESRWAIKSFNITYLIRYKLLLIQVLYKISVH